MVGGQVLMQRSMCVPVFFTATYEEVKEAAEKAVQGPLMNKKYIAQVGWACNHMAAAACNPY